eukprot:g10684.t1
MNLPPSSLLGRLEAFLPEMEKANQTTEKLAQEGKLEVLDSNLAVAGSDHQAEVAGEADEEEATEGTEQGEDGAEAGAVPPTRTVQLDFALGDFDDTPIAKMEQEKEAADGETEGVEAGAGEEQEDAVEGSGVASLLRVVPKAQVDAAAPREKPRKPLIQEL